jgi:cation diffusion facilitator family transporter
MSEKKTNISPERVVLVSFLVNITDISVNLFFALITGSVVMATQTLQGGADLIASGLLVFGVQKSKKRADKKHPYGYGREIYFWTFLSALITFVVTAGFSFYLGFQRFLDPEPISNVNFVIMVLIITTFSNGYSMSLSYRRLLGKEVHRKIFKIFLHSAFITSKTSFMIDLMGTLASILGLISIILYKLTGYLRFDGLGAMLIGLTTSILAIFVLKSAKDLLVGQSATPEIEEKIKSLIETFDKEVEVIDLRTLHMGTGNLLVDAEVSLKDDFTGEEIEKLIDKIKKRINDEIPEAKEITLELETPEVKAL